MNNEMAMLIDANELKSVITEDWFLDILLTQTGKSDMAKKLVDLIDSVPLAYNVDKVVEELESLRIDKSNYFGVLNVVAEKYDRANEMLNDAIDIVRKGGMK